MMENVLEQDKVTTISNLTPPAKNIATKSKLGKVTAIMSHTVSADFKTSKLNKIPAHDDMSKCSIW